MQKSVSCHTGDQPVIIPYLRIASGNVTLKDLPPASKAALVSATENCTRVLATG